MKQITQYQDGRLALQGVPVPTAPLGGVGARDAFAKGACSARLGPQSPRYSLQSRLAQRTRKGSQSSRHTNAYGLLK